MWKSYICTPNLTYPCPGLTTPLIAPKLLPISVQQLAGNVFPCHVKVKSCCYIAKIDVLCLKLNVQIVQLQLEDPHQVLGAIADLVRKQLRWPKRKEDLPSGLFSRELFTDQGAGNSGEPKFPNNLRQAQRASKLKFSFLFQ